LSVAVLPAWCARHLNGNPQDNRLLNLAWGTASENRDQRLHGTLLQGEKIWTAKLTKWNVLIDIPVYTAMGLTQAEIGCRLGVDQTAISCILLGKSWNYLYSTSAPVVSHTGWPYDYEMATD
jgi:hypothetical protein